MSNPAHGLDWLIDDFVARVPAAQQAVVLSVDGLLMGASRNLAQAEAEHMAAVAAGFASLSRSAGRHFQRGPVRQTIIEMETAFLLVTSAGQGSCLAVLAAADSDIGMVAYEMAMLVERIGHNLATQPRSTANAR
ncbi:MAG: roadblock/LC7 domain-containing protein [Hamadaea sp.]|uniref:roadblock/LC7 domain-containing protein n=1 Tax=Hamadaea sp. TaxID=2024425 RepID=UPI0017B07283|nr:roadblock/LC7 domain-containing protein [Hamadaea sp.]NUR72798.1 roadblock/LC7 domain-containing protein [Hamadaea sp.]NUT18010.1 roadblock/LC7 domain-containing protein [Hamadaea sp.]